MRLRHKPWAIPEMRENPSVFFADDGQAIRGHWQEHYPSAQPLHLDLGAGRGRYTLMLAERAPELNVLGIEISTDAIGIGARALQEAQEEGRLTNARFLVTDLNDCARFFAPDEVDSISINFCNPWPKRRHQKRRLTHPRLLREYAQFLKDGARLYFKTDDDGLYLASLDYLRDFGFELVKTEPDLPAGSDPYGIVTEYEERYRGLGIPIKYIEAIYHKPQPDEPQAPESPEAPASASAPEEEHPAKDASSQEA